MRPTSFGLMLLKSMGPLDFLNHLVNLVLPALAVGAWTGAVAKLVWRRDLRSVPLVRLCLWACGAGLLGSVAGLVLTGQDGRVLGYALLVATSGLGAWWAGWGRR